MSFKWSRDAIEKCIIFVQESECIYNVRSADYLDRIKKAQAFNNICSGMKKEFPDISVEEVRKKWKSLRTQFMAEQRRVQNSKKSGAGASDVYRPRLWCFDQLMFLKSHTQTRPSQANIEANTEADIDEIIEYSPQGESDFQPIEDTDFSEKGRSKGSSTMKLFQKDLSSVKSMIANRKSEKKFAWLGALVVSQMDEIDTNDQTDAAWEIQCVMKKYVDKAKNKRTKRTSSTSTSQSSRDILELSMDGVFDEDDLI